MVHLESEKQFASDLRCVSILRKRSKVFATRPKNLLNRSWRELWYQLNADSKHQNADSNINKVSVFYNVANWVDLISWDYFSQLLLNYYYFDMQTKIFWSFWKTAIPILALAKRIRIIHPKKNIFRTQGGLYYNVSRDFGDKWKRDHPNVQCTT